LNKLIFLAIPAILVLAIGFGFQESYARHLVSHELTHTVQQFKLSLVDVDGNTVTGVQCSAADSSGTTIVGPKGEEIWSDKHGKVKVKFHWDVSEPSNQIITITCFSRDVSGTQSFDTTTKGERGYNEFVMDDTSGSEPTSTPKSNNNMIIKGKKILENGRPAGLDECRITTKTSDGDPDRPIIVGSIPNSGVVKLFNISLDKVSADVECKFEGDAEFGEVITVELKEKGTTVVIVSDPGSGIRSPG